MAAPSLYLYWGAASPEAFRWLLQQEGKITHSGESTLKQLADQYVGLRTTLLVPTEELLLTSVSVPTRNKQKLRQAVPFALEERLIDDVDELHYAIGPVDHSGLRSVAVIKRSKMSEWLKPFDDAGLRITACLPDIFTLPQSEGGWTLLIEDNRALLRTASEQGYALPVEDLSELIHAELVSRDKGDTEQPTKIEVIDCRSDEARSPVIQIGDDQLEVAVEHLSCNEGLETLIAPLLDKAPPFNLLQGEFSRKEQLWRHLKPWRAAAILLFAALLLGATGWVVEYQRLTVQEQELQAGIEKLYREIFPDARKIINPRLQMEQRLAQLNKGQDAPEFSHLMVTAIPVLLKVEGVEVEVLRYKEGNLEMDLHLKDLPSIDKLKGLMESAGFELKVQNASSSAGRVTGRVIISRRPS